VDARPVCLLVLTILATGLIKHCALAVRSTYRLHFCRRYVCDRCTAITQSCVGLTLVFYCHVGPLSQNLARSPLLSLCITVTFHSTTLSLSLSLFLSCHSLRSQSLPAFRQKLKLTLFSDSFASWI